MGPKSKQPNYDSRRCLGFRRSFKGRILTAYRNLKARCEGTANRCTKYKGLTYPPQDEFVQWAANHVGYANLYEIWKANGFAREFTPTPDRIDPTQGYHLDNLRWLPWLQNVRLRRPRKKKH